MREELPEVMGHVTDEHGQKHILHRGPVQHESLSPQQLQRIARLREVLTEAYPMTMDGWVDGFKRDAFPETEIQTIEACAVVYRDLTQQAQLSADENKRLYGVLCAVSCGVDEAQLVSAVPQGRGLPPLGEIIRQYVAARRSGSKP
jgi:hypothetical protein